MAILLIAYTYRNFPRNSVICHEAMHTSSFLIVILSTCAK